jgi:hypothetical protein
MDHRVAAYVLPTFSSVLRFFEWGVLEDSYLSMGHRVAAYIFLLTFSSVLRFF